jgi:ElaB/YqjD/DUF883 family membrane-anchored ribosome-binding protein
MEQPTEHTASQTAFSRKIDAVTGSMHRAIDSAADAASPALQQLASSAHSSVDNMAGGANNAAEAISTKGAQLQHLQQQLAGSVRNQVRSHPLIAITLALAGGVLFSRLLSRRGRADAAS